RLLREFKIEANVGSPQVSYKETIREKARAEGRFIRQSGGRGQYGHVIISIEPNEKGKGFEFIDNVRDGDIPNEYIPAVEEGIKGAMMSGVLAGYNVVDVIATLEGGSYHEVDSSEMAFKIAGSMAFRAAMQKASPTLTEPIMQVAVICPDEYTGEVIGDIVSKRGNITNLEPANGVSQIAALVPLSNMFGYATDMRSKTQGRGVYTMQPSHYAEVPKSIQDQICVSKPADY
ncbi:MAG: elongation factor G, partial [Eubacteriales bacterium]